MPATVTTKEYFEGNIDERAIDEEIRLRIKAGAIRSWKEKQQDKWVLFTEWNVIGEQ